MPRPEKVEAVAEIMRRLQEAEAVFVAEYAGLTVKEQQQLRRRLRAAGGEFKVAKMTLTRRAAEELGHQGLLEMLTGPTGLTFASGDITITAKALRDFSNEHARLVIKGGLLADEVLAPERVGALADVEPRPILLAKIAGALEAPLAAMAGLLAAMPRSLATLIQQLIDKAPSVPEEPATEETSVPQPAPEASAEEPAPETPEEEGGDQSAAEASTGGSMPGDAPEGDHSTGIQSTDEEKADQAEEE